jgi:carbonic anhydrase
LLIPASRFDDHAAADNRLRDPPINDSESHTMQKLVDGVHRFQQDVFSSHERFFQRLVDGQKPLALFITCSDSRIDPNMITQTEPGELFILRNAGNIVPTYSNSCSGEAATIEYAVAVLNVQDVIVCGHSHCGAMGALLEPEQVADLPSVRGWLGHAEATSRIIKENYSHITDPQARLTATVEENVRCSSKICAPIPVSSRPWDERNFGSTAGSTSSKRDRSSRSTPK